MDPKINFIHWAFGAGAIEHMHGETGVVLINTRFERGSSGCLICAYGRERDLLKISCIPEAVAFHTRKVYAVTMCNTFWGLLG